MTDSLICHWVTERLAICPRQASESVLGLSLCLQHARILEKRLAYERDRPLWAAEDADLTLAAPDPGPCMVYFAQRHHLVKIGYARNLAARLRAIERGSGIIPGMAAGPVDLLTAIPGGQEKEAALHDRFRHLRAAGEWFLYNRELSDFIDMAEDERTWELSA